MRKGWVIGIIVLFISIGNLSSVSSKDISISDDKILEYNPEIEPLDEYEEIITFIEGWCDLIRVKRRGIFIHFDVELYADTWGLIIKGIRKPFNTFEEDVLKVNIPCFIGIFSNMGQPYRVDGIAFGNIEWITEWS